MAAEVRANGDAAAASKTEWYAGATRFELELEVPYGFLCVDAPPRCQSATATSLTPTPVRPIPLKPLLPAPPVRAKVLRGRRLCRMVQVPQILLPARVSPFSLVRLPSRVALWRYLFPFPRAEKLKSASLTF